MPQYLQVRPVVPLGSGKALQVFQAAHVAQHIFMVCPKQADAPADQAARHRYPHWQQLAFALGRRHGADDIDAACARLYFGDRPVLLHARGRQLDPVLFARLGQRQLQQRHAIFAALVVVSLGARIQHRDRFGGRRQADAGQTGKQQSAQRHRFHPDTIP
ncbi:hypothetical protein [Duganella sp. LjRoot269]|uniref:hypothetical protein n=1 Tax=Duganella sp. LjRoot269 TaxID=3342305 RepID=UPI003ECCD082